MPRLVVLLAALTLPVMLTAQTPLAFDAVSIKPADPAARSSAYGTLEGTHWRAANVTLMDLLRTRAYDEYKSPGRIVSAPSWATTRHYDIEATTTGTVSAEQTKTMLQRMLADRFLLKTHLEQRPVDVYVLTKARPDGKLGRDIVPSTPACVTAGRESRDLPKECLRFVDAGGAIGTMMMHVFPVQSLGMLLEGRVGRPVVDRTGLTGMYDLRLEYSGSPASPADVSIFTAVQEQLGLKLQPGRESMDVLVVDVALPPEAN